MAHSLPWRLDRWNTRWNGYQITLTAVTTGSTLRSVSLCIVAAAYLPPWCTRWSITHTEIDVRAAIRRGARVDSMSGVE